MAILVVTKPIYSHKTRVPYLARFFNTLGVIMVMFPKYFGTILNFWRMEKPFWNLWEELLHPAKPNNIGWPDGGKLETFLKSSSNDSHKTRGMLSINIGKGFQSSRWWESFPSLAGMSSWLRPNYCIEYLMTTAFPQ